jgi:peptidoglycan L-alanyl-D-glutamate endopeptidase CwlK
MEYTFSKKSKSKLKGVHPDLVAIANYAIEHTEYDFSILEGVRSVSRQKELVSTGKSQTMNSRHITGHAIDIVPYPVSWEWDDFYPVCDVFLKASRELNIPLRWGGNWKVNDLRKWRGTSKLLHSKYRGSFPDAPHFELPRRFYGD